MTEKATPTIAMTPCVSSIMTHHGYDHGTNTLAVTFKHGGTTYHYAGVTPDMYSEMIGAESIGSFFTKNIKAKPDVYPYTKQVPESDDTQ